MDSEIHTVKNWYIWLYISPIFTICLSFILAFILFLNTYTLNLDNEYPTPFYKSLPRLILVFVIIPGLLHLILLWPAFRGKTVFIRWHGRQALLLAAIRTLLMLFTVICLFISGFSILALLLLFALLLVWFFGTFLSYRQASKGDCLLMRWIGMGDSLPGKPLLAADSVVPAQLSVEEMVSKIRAESDPSVRAVLLNQLSALGMVESLQ